MIILEIAIAFILVFMILQQPYLGIVFTAASLPIADVLPDIPFASSIVPIIGGVTLVAYLMNRKRDFGKRRFSFVNVHILGLLFIGWIFISNPSAAWFGLDRNWIFTFFQLWILALLAGELLDNPEKHHAFMWAYALITAMSALIAIQQGGQFGVDIDVNRRVSGLAEGSNTAARYFVVAMLFFNYLRSVVNNSLARFIATLGGIVTFFGVFFTVSRTGILLMFISVGLLILLTPRRKYQFQLIVIFIIITLALWFLSDNIINLFKSIMPSITKGTDTVGLRYALWTAGWRMWLENIIRGVGIGMYPRELRNFGQDLMAPLFLRGAVAHNMYIQILAETGIVGFGLFVAILIKSMQNIWRADNANDLVSIPLRNIWFIVFLVMILGGITKSDQADKMIWLAMGVSIYFYNQSGTRPSKIIEDKISQNTSYRKRDGLIRR